MLKTIASIVLLTASSASAVTCGDTKKIHDELLSKYGESPRTVATAQGNIVSQYANEETGTWTLVVITPDGKTCLIASGEAWEALLAVKAGEEM